MEIEEYCNKCGLSYVTDATNADTAYTRNYLRHAVLPLLKERNPNLLATLGRMAQTLREDSAYLEAEADKLLQRVQTGPDRVSCAAAELLALPEALRPRLVQRMAEHLLPGTVLTASQRERVLALCRSERPGAVCVLTGGLRARREYAELVLTAERAPEQAESIPLRPGERVRFRDRVLVCEEALCPEGKFNRPYTYYLRPADVLLLRAPRSGEHITLPGRPRKSVKKLLSDAKVPLHRRGAVLALEAEGALCALDGFGADVNYLPKPGERCWKIASAPVEEEPPSPHEKETNYGTG